MTELKLVKPKNKLKKITIWLNEDTAKEIKRLANESEVNVSKFIRSTLTIMLHTVIDQIEMKDIQWVKYLFPLGIMVNGLKHHIEKENPDNKDLLVYVDVMTNSIENFINSVAYAKDYEIPLELEQKYIDAITIFCSWLDSNKITDYSVKKLGEKLKQQLKE